jgi:hypothetical protein
VRKSVGTAQTREETDTCLWSRVPVVDVPSGDGLVYQTALAVESKNKNFLEVRKSVGTIFPDTRGN